VVTIDDVLDYLLPDDWRSTSDEPSGAPDTSTSTIVIPRKGRRTTRGTR
jgi:hypothetical protein